MTIPSHTNHTICSNPNPYARSLSAGTTLTEVWGRTGAVVSLHP